MNKSNENNSTNISNTNKTLYTLFNDYTPKKQIHTLIPEKQKSFIKTIVQAMR